MKKYAILILIGLVGLVGVLWWKKTSAPETGSTDYKTATYVIEGQRIALGSEGTKYFGNEVRHDLNDDGREDVAFLLTREPGGSGTFFYAVVALNTLTGYVGSEAFFLGDRIAPQPITIDEGLTSRGTYRQNVIVVNYADRLPGEPFTARPSMGKSVWLKLNPETMQFGEVVQNFEGESR